LVVAVAAVVLVLVVCCSPFPLTIQIDFYMLFPAIAIAPQFWLSVVLITAFSILPDFSLKWLQQNIYPSDWQILKVRGGENPILFCIFARFFFFIVYLIA
jgi:hypothetical protein